VHRIPYQDCDVLNATFDDTSASCLIVEPKMLVQLFAHIRTSCEIALEVGGEGEGVRVRTFHHNHACTGSALQHLSTEMAIGNSEFELISRSREDQQQDQASAVELVFALKEVITHIISHISAPLSSLFTRITLVLYQLKALLMLCDSAQVTDVSMSFSCGGRWVGK
jgi:hypothetical protein